MLHIIIPQPAARPTDLDHLVPKNKPAPVGPQSLANLAHAYLERVPGVQGNVCSKEQAATPEKRFWVKVYLSADCADVQPILERWSQQRRKAPTLAGAIRLMDAIERGDLDVVREIAPLLPAALAGQAKAPKRTRVPLRGSESIKESGFQKTEETAHPEKSEQPAAPSPAPVADPMVQTLAEVTLVDPVVNPRKVANAAKRLGAGGYTPEQVQDWHERYWKKQDWRGKKGEQPNLEQVLEQIGKVRVLPVREDEAVNYYLRDEYFQRRAQDDAAQADQPPEEEAALRPIDPRHRNWWIAELGQLQVQLNRTTFESWVRGARLVEAHDLTWWVQVANTYQKDWLERHLIPAMREALARFMSRPQTNEPVTAEQVTIIVEVAERVH